MTVGEFVNGYVDCAINNVPLEEAKAIAAMFPTYNIRNDFDVYVELGWAKPVVHMRFFHGRFYNWINGYYPYDAGTEDFYLQAAVSFDQLKDEDEIDVSFDILADIL